MKSFTLIPLAVLIFSASSCAQKKDNSADKPKYDNVGGGCEGCDAVYESPVSFDELSWIDTLPDFSESGTKICVSGVVFKKDGVTPAPGVVLYFYHTDQKGYYSGKGDETGWGRRHGYIRGWLKTNEKGEYKFFTLRPAPYPNTDFPAHIHPTVKEADKNPYWIDDYVFDDDPFVNDKYRSREEKRCGRGIITLTSEDSVLYYAKRDIILGLNIPNYPEQK